MRRVEATFDQHFVGVRRVVALNNLAIEWEPTLKFVVPINNNEERHRVHTLRSAGGIDVAWVRAVGLEEEDIVIPLPCGQEVEVLYRASDQHHSLFVTNRCNSYCLMCSQPPTKQDDSWLVLQVIEIISHIKASPKALGITGGEPLLLGASLLCILDAIAACHPTTRVEILSNGRLFSSANTVNAVLTPMKTEAVWMIPLYGHADFIHDFVVQSPGAFEETLEGLLTLREHQQRIQLRVVLIEPVLQVLEDLCSFIGRNLPFAHEVALMACEPTGFALANRDACEVDLAAWGKALEKAASVLQRHEVSFIFMNTPLCALPRSLWMHAHKSISDWKNSYIAECDGCDMKASCSGLFDWAHTTWLPTKISAIKEDGT